MALTVDIEKKFKGFRLRSKFKTEGETLAILGASGCGKSLTLKCIAGVEKPDRGYIELDGRVLFDSENNIDLPARVRGVGYLFQDYALFPNMTVEENIGCGIKKGRDRAVEIKEKIDVFFLEGLEKKYPSQLSGGQKQRVALARMLASRPCMIMLDEPFSALDSFLKWQLEQEILSLQEQFTGSILFVSHNRDEVYRLCDRVVVMEDGKTQDVLPKKEMFADPKTLSATLLSGCKNISAAQKTGERALFAKDWNVHLETAVQVPDDLAYVGFRAHYFEVADEKGINTMECSVTRVVEDMFSIIVMARTAGGDQGNARAYLRYELSKDKWTAFGNPQKLLLKMPAHQLILMR
jgi:molybdate transport system ATP-binding protein